MYWIQQTCRGIHKLTLRVFCVCHLYNALYLKVQFEAVFTIIPVSNDKVFKNVFNMVLQCVIFT